MSYPNVLFVAELESLETRRNNQSRSCFHDICKPTSCLYHLIPPPRDTSVIMRLKPNMAPLPKPSLRTKKYCSFINFGLHHYQPKKYIATIALCTSLPLHLCYVCCLFWFLLFLCTISLAFHLLFGPRAASLLLNWLTDWLVDLFYLVL